MKVGAFLDELLGTNIFDNILLKQSQALFHRSEIIKIGGFTLANAFSSRKKAALQAAHRHFKIQCNFTYFAKSFKLI